MVRNTRHGQALVRVVTKIVVKSHLKVAASELWRKLLSFHRISWCYKYSQLLDIK
ncbi:hypothetical protein P3S68_002672 [Capsicum galapagoense]